MNIPLVCCHLLEREVLRMLNCSLVHLLKTVLEVFHLLNVIHKNLTKQGMCF